MSLLTLSNISHSYCGDNILQDITFSIEKNNKIGIVGKNGSGKTTLFNIITGLIQPQKGEILFAKNIKIAHLKQEFIINSENSLYNEIYESHQELLQLFDKIKKIELSINNNYNKKKIKELSLLQEKINILDGYTYENKVKNVLTNLGFYENCWNQSINNFSGGEKTRIQLAKILLNPFDILLLDEPTNHLDFHMIFWLENYLSNINKPYIIISHDRSFLDKTVSTIFQISNKKITKFSGNYSFYITENKKLIEQQKNEYTKQQKFIEKTEDFIKRNMAGQKVKQAKSRLKMLNKLDKIEKIHNEHNYNLNIESQKRSGNNVITIENLSLAISNKKLLENVDLLLKYKEKIVIIGKNGCGKTTLLKSIIKNKHIDSGFIKIGSNVSIGYYDQLNIKLNKDSTIIENIWNKMPNEPINKPLSYLARFGFSGDIVNSPIKHISGGEKARLYLASIILEKPNLLILDEPTNHLDISMIESLESALKNYDGSILFVSHDKYFIEKTASKIWLFENKKIIEKDVNLENIFYPPKKEKKEKISTRIKKQKTNDKKINPIKIEFLLKEIEEIQEEIKNIKIDLDNLNLSLIDKKIYTNTKLLKNTKEKINLINTKLKENETLLDEKETLYLNWTL